MPIIPLRRNIVSEELYRQMLGFINTGEWKSGQKIPSEAELKEQFAVSRISVREALQKLSALGLINSKPGLGTFVANVSSDLYIQNLIPVFLLDKPGIVELLEFRKAVELECAKLASQRGSNDEIKELALILGNLKKNKDNLSEYAEYDFRFHMMIFNMTKNQLFIKINLMLQDTFKEGFLKQTVAAKKFDYVQHREIYLAIENHDPEAAVTAMRNHINTTMERIKE